MWTQPKKGFFGTTYDDVLYAQGELKLGALLQNAELDAEVGLERALPSPSPFTLTLHPHPTQTSSPAPR